MWKLIHLNVAVAVLTLVASPVFAQEFAIQKKDIAIGKKE